MKKLTFLFVTALLFLTSCGKEKSFDENLQKAWQSMGNTMAYSAEVGDEIYKTWHTAIFDHKTPSGKYCSDFNDALDELYETFKEEGKIDSVYHYKNEMIDNTSKLTPPPSSRKDCYDDFVALVSEISSLSRMATEPSGSLKTYSEQIREKGETIVRLVEQFKIKYSEYLDNK